jgi:hypothetical protein
MFSMMLSILTGLEEGTIMDFEMLSDYQIDAGKQPKKRDFTFRTRQAF